MNQPSPSKPSRSAAPPSAAASSSAADNVPVAMTSTHDDSVYRPNIDARRLRKAFLRRTIDYAGGLVMHSQIRQQFYAPTRRPSRALPYVQPDVEFLVNVMPPTATPDQPAISATSRFVHTSMNKYRTYVNVVRWTPEGRRLITGSASGEFTLWNGLTFNFETILQAHESSIRSMRWSRTGTYLLSGDNLGAVKYWQANMNNLKTIATHKDAVRGISFSPSDAKFATCSDDKTVKVWSFHTGQCEQTMLGHGWDVKCVDWHGYKGMVASGSKDSLVKLWDPRMGKGITTLHGHKSTVHALQWNRNGNWLLSGSRDQTIKLWDMRVMRECANFKGHPKEVCSVAWHPIQESLFVSGGSDGSLHYWLTTSPSTPISTVPTAHDANIWALDWHPLGHVLCTGSNDYATRFWTRERPGESEFAPVRELLVPNPTTGEVDERLVAAAALERDRERERKEEGAMGRVDDGASSSMAGSTGGFYLPGFGTIGILSDGTIATGGDSSSRPGSRLDSDDGSEFGTGSRAASPDAAGGSAPWRAAAHPSLAAFASSPAPGADGAAGAAARPNMTERDIEREEMRKRRKEMFDDFFGPRRRGGGPRSQGREQLGGTGQLPPRGGSALGQAPGGGAAAGGTGGQ